MKKFIPDETLDSKKTHANNQSNFIKIPLLNSKADNSSNECNSYQKNRSIIEQNNFALLDFKAKKQFSNTIISNQTNLNKELVKDLHSKNKYIIQNFRNFPLLKLNSSQNIRDKKQLDYKEKTKNSIEEEKIISTEIIINDETIKTKQESKLNTEEPKKNIDISSKNEKEIQCQKIMYDGYILAPNSFENMVDHQNKDMFSDLHYKATEHLRKSEANKNNIQIMKKEIYTMTDSIGNADPLAPDILFKLKFDTKRKNRQLNENDNEEFKDFVNVVDL
jgi:hypothetical protein